MGRPFFRKYTSPSAYRNAVSSVTFTTRTDGLLRNWANCAVFSAHRFTSRNPLYNSPKTTADKQTDYDLRRTYKITSSPRFSALTANVMHTTFTQLPPCTLRTHA